MSYSAEALAFSTIPASHQIRIADRVSFLYVEYCLIRQDRTGVVAIQAATNDDDNPSAEATIRRIQLPVAGLGVLCLGPEQASRMLRSHRALVLAVALFFGWRRSERIYVRNTADVVGPLGYCSSPSYFVY